MESEFNHRTSFVRAGSIRNHDLFKKVNLNNNNNGLILISSSAADTFARLRYFCHVMATSFKTHGFPGRTLYSFMYLTNANRQKHDIEEGRQSERQAESSVSLHV